MGKATAQKKSSSADSGLNFEAQLWAAADKMRRMGSMKQIFPLNLRREIFAPLEKTSKQ